MVKDPRPYYVKNAEQKAFHRLAMDVLEKLKVKDNIEMSEEILKNKIFEQIEKDIKEEIEGFKINIYGIPDNNYDAMKLAKEAFDELHLYGRVKRFFKDTGIAIKIGRDEDGDKLYIFYDVKKIFVKKEG